MTKDEAQSIAADIASDIMLHDVPKRLHNHGVASVYVNSLARVEPNATKALELAILEYLAKYDVVTEV